jgi:hypothetical protein
MSRFGVFFFFYLLRFFCLWGLRSLQSCSLVYVVAKSNPIILFFSFLCCWSIYVW